MANRGSSRLSSEQSGALIGEQGVRFRMHFSFVRQTEMPPTPAPTIRQQQRHPNGAGRHDERL